jgi:hypothetical protein
MAKSLTLRAAVEWHKAGRLSSPKAASVQLAQSLIDELLRARTLIQTLTLQPDATTTLPDEWLTAAVSFNVDTNDLEQFRQ